MALVRRSKAASSSDFFPGFTDIVEIGVGSLARVYRAREIGTRRHARWNPSSANPSRSAR